MNETPDKSWQIRIVREIKALASLSKPDSISWDQVKKALIDGANSLRIEAAQITAPIELSPIEAKRLILSGPPLKNISGPEAILMPVNNGFVLRLNQNLPWHRLRFTNAHEIGHTFFYDINKSPPARFLPSFQKEEWICDCFASELLMPTDLLTQYMNEHNIEELGRQLEAINGFAELFEVSLEALVRRLMKDFSKLANSIALFIGPVKPEGVVQLQHFRGKSVKNYLRKGEDEAFAKMRDLLETNITREKLLEFSEVHSKIASVEWIFSRLQAKCVLISFRR